jgi:hypothetical protein
MHCAGREADMVQAASIFTCPHRSPWATQLASARISLQQELLNYTHHSCWWLPRLHLSFLVTTLIALI